MKILPWMFCHKNIPLLGHGDMCVDFRNIYRTVSQHFLNVANVDVCFQQACGERVPEHMGRDVQVNGSKRSIFVNHSANGLVRQCPA